jgi:hypothetical protein
MGHCKECFHELDGPYENAGQEYCSDCEGYFHHESYNSKKDRAESDFLDLLAEGYGCQAAAHKLQDEYDLSDSECDRMALEYQSIKGELMAQWRGEI